MCSFILRLIPPPVFDYMHGGERPGEGNILGRGMSWGGACPGEGMSWGGHGRRGGLFCGVMSRTYKNPSLLQSYINIAFLPFAVLISRFRRCNVACIAKCSRILLLWCRKVMCVVHVCECVYIAVYTYCIMKGAVFV